MTRYSLVTPDPHDPENTSRITLMQPTIFTRELTVQDVLVLIAKIFAVALLLLLTVRGFA